MTLHGDRRSLGAGYTATQSVIASATTAHHYGVAPQALASVRLIAGRRASLDVTAREYFVSDVGGLRHQPAGRHFPWRRVARVTARRPARGGDSGTCSRERDARPPALPEFEQTRATIGVFYTFLGPGGFGAVR